MKKQNKDAADSMSALEILTRAVYLLQREYTPVYKPETELHRDMLNLIETIDDLRIIESRITKERKERLDVAKAEAPFD